MDSGDWVWMGLAMVAIVIGVRRLGQLGERVINETFSETLVCCSDRRPVDVVSEAGFSKLSDAAEPAIDTDGASQSETGAVGGGTQWPTGLAAGGRVST